MHPSLLHVLTMLLGYLADPSVLQDGPLPAFTLPLLPPLEVIELVHAQVCQAHRLPQVLCPGVKSLSLLLSFLRDRGLQIRILHLSIEVLSLREDAGLLWGHLTGSR
jgi:hypothetical protein